MAVVLIKLNILIILIIIVLLILLIIMTQDKSLTDIHSFLSTLLSCQDCQAPQLQ